MKKFILVGSLSLICLIFLLLAVFMYFPTLLPTKSSPRKLSIVTYNISPVEPVTITLINYQNDIHISGFALFIKNGIHIQEVQSYELPKISYGTVEASIELKGEINNSFTLCFDQAEVLYRNGLLVYLAFYGEYYVYFVSGQNTTCYRQTLDSGEWMLVTEFPPRRILPQKENPGFTMWYSMWKENKWVAINAVAR